MVRASVARRTDDECVLPECAGAGVAYPGSAGRLPGHSATIEREFEESCCFALRLPFLILCGRAGVAATDIFDPLSLIRGIPRNGIYTDLAMGLAFTVVSGTVVLRKSRSVFVDAALIDRDGRTSSILAEVPDDWNSRHLRADGFLLLHGIVSGLGRHFFIRKSIFCFADGVFCAWAGDSAGCDCVTFPQPRGRLRVAGICVKYLYHLECGADFSVGNAPDSSARAGILERCGAESNS